MVIELRGVEFVNKGAELMFHAIKQQLDAKFPNAILVMEKTARAPRNKHIEFDVYTKLNFQRFKINWGKYGHLIPKSTRIKNNLILEEEVDIIIDASGFAFGDQWGADYGNRRLANKISVWKENGKKIILLPQAFGPFNKEGMSDMMETILKNAELIFAREEKSLQFLKELEFSESVYKFPDFTNLIKGNVPSEFDSQKNQIPIIPNYKMIEKGVSKTTYLKFLVHCIEYMQSLKLNPFFLIHEGKRDQQIADEVNKMINDKIDIIDPKDPIKVKGIIGVSQFVISSRYHGLISALSQGIPCITTTWSHKYKLVAQEYEVEKFLVDDLEDFSAISNSIQELADSSKRQIITERLLDKSQKFKIMTKEMWSKVFKVING
ncbi:polysaccharide pyruvyl transferase family protein [uncultured Christiangramia sp.]|uniref:polysaccharide pyruvyl transferase family protein n=1 Tax=uncultured Christiangramia sp. TaxID=503836 RepID=UPI002630C7C7|nr:polysaccharide pyruvyl transferase family protein [uncultured Christiangramia sp.]